MPQRLIGGDQQPLLRGILRALVIREKFPEAELVYTFHDGDVVGRERAAPPKWVNHNGGYVSWCHEFPWTPRVPGAIDQKTAEALTRKGFPPPAIRIEGEGAGTLLGEARFQLVHLLGFGREVDWAVKMGGERRKADALLALASGLLGRTFREAVQAIADHVLENSGFETIPVVSLREFLSGALELERFADRLPPDWRWAAGERLSGLPRATYLPLEIAHRGRLFATNLLYWGDVAEAARGLGLDLEPYLSVRFADQPPAEYGKVVQVSEFPKLHQNGHALAWRERWSARPSLIFSYLVGSLRRVVEMAMVR